MTAPDPTTDDVTALEPLIRVAMAAGSMCAAERARDGLIDPLAPLGDVFGDFPAEFLRIRYLLAERALARVRAEALREAADEIESTAAGAWGGNRAWLTTGTHVGNLVTYALRERADRVERGAS